MKQKLTHNLIPVCLVLIAALYWGWSERSVAALNLTSAEQGACDQLGYTGDNCDAFVTKVRVCEQLKWDSDKCVKNMFSPEMSPSAISTALSSPSPADTSSGNGFETTGVSGAAKASGSGAGSGSGNGSGNASTNSVIFCDKDNYEYVNGMCLPKSKFGGFAGTTELRDLIEKIVKFVLGLSGVVAVILLVLGGFWYMTSGGNEEQAEKGRKTLINSVVGLIVIMLAYTIVSIVVDTISK